MSPRMERYWRALTRTDAATAPTADDPRLRGRTYAIPFEDVWQALVSLADGGLKGWRLRSADDQRGRLEAVAPVLLGRASADVEVEVGLDENAQTRVDASARVLDRKRDLGASARCIGRLFTALDDAVERPRAGRAERATTPIVSPERAEHDSAAAEPAG